jgi:glycosyltransferase involved in cell wall biosynthesis
VAILLATYNGAPWLREQLDSLLRQTHDNWVLYWRDDGSGDGTLAILQAFGQRAGQGRCIQLAEPPGRIGAAGSFIALLRSVCDTLAERDMVAFADQDDIWLPQKLERGIAALRSAPRDAPVLYCARQILVDNTLQQLGISRPLSRPAGFPTALTQNVATGCTVMLNCLAAKLVAASRPSTGTLHDWWAYLLVAAAGGKLIQDDEPVVLYRQHALNLVGAPASMVSRAIAALKRGPALFMTVLREHIAALLAQPELISERARAELATLDRALHSNFWHRLAALRTPGLYRQTWPETLLFRCWFLMG